MGKKTKTTIMCDVCHKPIVEEVNTDISWYHIPSADTKRYFQVCREDGTDSSDCCSIECVTKNLESRIDNAINLLVKREIIHYDK